MMKRAGHCLLIWALLGLAAEGQTACGLQHESPGVYICYPNPNDNPGDAVIPEMFHLSAQGNAPGSKTISHFRVLLDDHVVYENWLTPPGQSLSIETNLRSPFDSGEHSLQLVMDGVGTAQVKGLLVVPAKNATFCDPFFRIDPRMCILSKRTPLGWSLTESSPPPTDSLDEYVSFLDLFGRNLKALEADESDAVAIDQKGNVYVASHAFSDVEVRKYAANGSIVYDSLIRSCGDGLLSVAGLAIDNAGRAWIAGNTTACFPATPGAFQNDSGSPKGMRGFVILMDTTKPSSAAPVNVTYLSDVEYHIDAIRVDQEGNVYLAGTAESAQYPHESVLVVPEDSDVSGSRRPGFVSVLNGTGSGLRWSTLLPNVALTALSLDGAGNVYVTGRMLFGPSTAEAGDAKGSQGPPRPSCDLQGKPNMMCDGLLVAEITDHGRQLFYAALLGGSGDQQGRAISLSPRGNWVFVAADTNSASLRPPQSESRESVVIALQPCQTGLFNRRFIPNSTAIADIVFPVALDAFASTFSQRFDQPQLATSVQEPRPSIRAAPPCVSQK